MADLVRLQVKTTRDPDKYEDVGAGAVGVPVPVIVEGSGLPSGAATSDKQDDIIAKFPFEDYLFSGSQTIGDYTYIGKRQHNSGAFTGEWLIMRLDDTDDSSVTFAFSSVGGHSWATAWGDPTGESFS